MGRPKSDTSIPEACGVAAFGVSSHPMSGALMAYPRFCVWCGARVPKNATRDLCVGHQNLASTIERRIQDRLEEDSTPMPIPLVRDADRPPNDGL